MTDSDGRRHGRLAHHLQGQERTWLISNLQKVKGHLSQLATVAGISRRALYDKLNQHDLWDLASRLREAHGVQGPRPQKAQPSEEVQKLVSKQATSRQKAEQMIRERYSEKAIVKKTGASVGTVRRWRKALAEQDKQQVATSHVQMEGADQR